jgi:hypothetical protein
MTTRPVTWVDYYEVKIALEKADIEIERLQANNEKLSRIGIALNRRVANLERDLSVEVAAGHDATERAEAAERERDEARDIVRRIDAAISGKGEL